MAAGSSSRMGIAKQGLPYNNSTLLQHAVATAINTTAGNVVVVLGANAEAIIPTITSKIVTIVINTNWANGLGSSVSTGIEKLVSIQPLVNAVLIMLCDQPLVNTALLDQLLETKAKDNKGLVACGYNNTVGVPAVFDKKYFPALLSLQGNTGARMILHQHNDDITIVPFPGGAIDIDTPEDFKRLLQL